MNECAAQSAGKPNTFAVDVCTCIAPHLDCAWIVSELDADLFEDRFGVVFDQLEVFVGDQLVWTDLA